MAQQKYTALTIGPIFDTMEFASKPGALWTASYIFSFLTKCLCEEIVEHKIPKDNIITPFFDPSNALLNKGDGVGLFHDRIIFIHDENTCIDIAKIKKNAIAKVLAAFGFDKNEEAINYLNEYILIADATFDSTDKDGNPVNPIFKAGEILDSLELSKTFTYQSKSNPLLTVFTGSANHANEEIKNLPAVGSLESWQLRKKGSANQLRSLADIATGGRYDLEGKNSPKPKDKKHYYYAVVRSDGDNMSSVISALGNDTEKIRNFSENCLRYCSEIAETAYNEFNGVTIFSGGDDLLAILPCESADGKSVFEYISTANSIFKKYFPDSNTSLSFGITVCYYKFPLYEALSESADLLFAVAKSDKYGKNCAAINLHKHSGQTGGIVIRNGESLNELLKLKAITDDINNTKETDKEQVLLSILYKLPMYENLFLAAGNNAEAVKNIFKNCFDAPAHAIDFIRKTIPDFYIKLVNQAVFIQSLETNDRLFDSDTGKMLSLLRDPSVKEQHSLSLSTLCTVLRIIKFFLESAGDKS